MTPAGAPPSPARNGRTHVARCASTHCHPRRTTSLGGRPMQPHRDRRPSTRRTVRTLHCTLVAALVLCAAVAAPRRAEAQLPVAAQVVAAVAQWMARWLGDYLLGRGVNVAMERVRGAAYREQLENLEQALRTQIRRGGANRSQLVRELKLVERQRRL